tara:strand:- start:402 stop:758 length:357 start_codon:yes stop_codon:yes gene_type:complete
MNRKAVFSEASIGTLHVSNLKVTGKHNLEGNTISLSPILPPSPPSSGGNDIQLLERLAILEQTINELKIENDTLRSRLDNMKLNDLADVEIEADTEDGSFLGFFKRDSVWLPYPEVGN